MPRPFTFMIKNGKAFVVMFRNFVCASGPVLEKCKEDLILPKKKRDNFSHVYTINYEKFCTLKLLQEAQSRSIWA